VKTLIVMRHAKSDWGDPQLADFDRPLNASGRSAAEAVGRELKRRGVGFDHVIASPATRVRHTLDHLRAGYGDFPEPMFIAALYQPTVETLVGAIKQAPEQCASLLLVAHNPGLQHLILELTRNAPSNLRDRVSERYPTGAAAVIRIAAASWSALEGSELADLIMPRELEAS
jgi:phosphohistidine phosphatase